MASQTLSRAQTVITAMRTTNVAKANVTRAVAVARPSQIASFGSQRCLVARSRKASTVCASAHGNGLSIDLRGAPTL